jgi:hypothetical protein
MNAARLPSQPGCRLAASHARSTSTCAALRAPAEYESGTTRK